MEPDNKLELELDVDRETPGTHQGGPADSHLSRLWTSHVLSKVNSLDMEVGDKGCRIKEVVLGKPQTSSSPVPASPAPEE